MTAQISLEFAGVTPDQYWAVNDALGVDIEDVSTWPDGLLAHTAGTGDGGAFVVTELWESQEAQGRFMDSQLGAALGKVGVPEPVRVQWTDQVAAGHR